MRCPIIKMLILHTKATMALPRTCNNLAGGRIALAFLIEYNYSLDRARWFLFTFILCPTISVRDLG
jgi:hypothetical protein